ncbi:MAG: hypothetical protein ABJK75_14620 [Tateyamaria sp.]|uniref:hypothetical protein n=1 Tax=Tateyamaria sp. TaxID=1929288 RepID=UPI00329F3B05
MLRFLLKTLQPPTAAEWKNSWKGISVGGAFALIWVVDSLGDDHSFGWFILEVFFAYVITFLSVIGHRIAESESNE